MKPAETVEYALTALIRAGADKAQCTLTQSINDELYMENSTIALNRTAINKTLRYKAIKDQRQAVYISNKTDKDSIDRDVKTVMEMAEASQKDEAYDISERKENKSFSHGPTQPDKEAMYRSLNSFLESVQEKFPHTIIENGGIIFKRHESIMVNSNGVHFHTDTSWYEFFSLFTTQKGKRSSSMNYSFCIFQEPDISLMKSVQTEILLKQSAEQLVLKSIPGTFQGDIIISPECLQDFLHYLLIYLRDHFIINGTSVFKDKLGKQIVDDRITLKSLPVSDEMHMKQFVSQDGYELENSTIIEKGKLKGFLLSDYASRKTGFPRAANECTHPVLEAGESSFNEMVQSIEKGLLLNRFSGGQPSDNGDFTGVAKNSYYIENGKIQFPVNEIMISGNLIEMFNSIKDISRERIHFGKTIVPYMSFKGITISGTE